MAAINNRIISETIIVAIGIISIMSKMHLKTSIFEHPRILNDSKQNSQIIIIG